MTLGSIRWNRESGKVAAFALSNRSGLGLQTELIDLKEEDLR